MAKKEEMEYEFHQILHDSTVSTHLLKMFTKEIRENYYIRDIVRNHEGEWILILRRTIIPKSMLEPTNDKR